MANNAGIEWTEEVITNRVTVSKNANRLRVSIKAPEFSWGNNFLTFCLTLGVLAEFAIAFLMVRSTVSLAILAPGFIGIGAGLGLAFTKFWLWHNFGEELININGNSFQMHRNYGLYKSDEINLVLNKESELYTNRNDTWSWLLFRGKGVFRLATVDAKLADFGLNLDDAEYELIIRPIAEQLDNFKKELNETPSTPTAQETTTQEEDSAIEAEAVIEEEIQPPSLEQQTKGQHANALNDYLEKTTHGKSAKKTDESNANKELKN